MIYIICLLYVTYHFGLPMIFGYWFGTRYGDRFSRGEGALILVSVIVGLQILGFIVIRL